MGHLYLDTKGFQPLETVESRKSAFWASAGIHTALFVLLVLLPLLFTETLTIKYEVVELTPPLPERQPLEVTYWKAPAPPKVEPEKMVAPPPVKPLVRKVEPPKPELLPKVEEIKPLEIPKPKVETPPVFPERVAETPKAPERPKESVKTGVFSSGSSAKPTTKLASREVQTGGFGDPNGARGAGNPDKVANIASLGSFDLPVGPGAGNGTGGANGVRGVVDGAGFGSGVAAPGKGGNGSRDVVASAGFGSGVAKPGNGGAAKKRDDGPAQTPIEVTFKPRPDYTAEAREKKLEGEVLIRALFTATGEVRGIEVIRGLGHGLDQNAIRAAQQIRFKPAQRNGQPVDSIATVHIVFQLAY